MIVTPHSDMPLELVRRHARLVVDTRGALRQPGLSRPAPAPAMPPPAPWPLSGMREEQAGFLGPQPRTPGARLPGDTKGDLAPGGGGAYIVPA